MAESSATDGTALPATVGASPAAIATALPRLRAVAETSDDPAELRHAGALARGMKETARALGIAELHADLSWIEETALRRWSQIGAPPPERRPDGTLAGVTRGNAGAMTGAERKRLSDARSRHAGLDDARFAELRQGSLLDREPATPRLIREAAGAEPVAPARPGRLVQLGRALDLVQKSEAAADVAGFDDDECDAYSAIGALLEASGREMQEAVAARRAAQPGAGIAPPARPVPAGTRAAAAEPRKGWPGPHTLTGETWLAYAESYLGRYGAWPVWNATIAGQLAQFVRRIGRADAPGVAAFYLRREDRWYAEKMHSVAALLGDAEKLRTAWATGLKAAPDTRPDPMEQARIARERREAREGAR